MGEADLVIAPDKNFNELVAANQFLIIMFYSPNCVHCKEIEPHFVEYSKQYHDSVNFAKINVMVNPLIVKKYRILGTPTFKLFCNAKPVQELVGAVYPHILKQAIDDVLTYGEDCAKKTSTFDTKITGYA